MPKVGDSIPSKPKYSFDVMDYKQCTNNASRKSNTIPANTYIIAVISR